MWHWCGTLFNICVKGWKYIVNSILKIITNYKNVIIYLDLFFIVLLNIFFKGRSFYSRCVKLIKSDSNLQYYKKYISMSATAFYKSFKLLSKNIKNYTHSKPFNSIICTYDVDIILDISFCMKICHCVVFFKGWNTIDQSASRNTPLSFSWYFISQTSLCCFHS